MQCYQLGWDKQKGQQEIQVEFHFPELLETVNNTSLMKHLIVEEDLWNTDTFGSFSP